MKPSNYFILVLRSEHMFTSNPNKKRVVPVDYYHAQGEGTTYIGELEYGLPAPYGLLILRGE